MMTKFVSTKHLVSKAVTRLTNIDKYARMMEMFDGGKGCKDTCFQKAYTHFYRVRRSRAWLDRYFEVMRRFACKKDSYSFADVLAAVDSIGGNRIEFSFSSKMMATLRTCMPIWDSHVRKALSLPPVRTDGSVSEREEDACRIYSELCERIGVLLREEDTISEIRKLNEVVPEYASKMSDVKKLDCLLWAAGC